MKLFPIGGEVEDFWRQPGRHQRTFETPLKDLPRFVSTIFSNFDIAGCVVTITSVVFEPKNLLKLLARHNLLAAPIPSRHEAYVTITAEGHGEAVSLLEAALGDWVELILFPSPHDFSIFADHDERITFFSNDHDTLSTLAAALTGKGFKEVPGWTR